MQTSIADSGGQARAIAITGSGGSGALTAGQILLAAVAAAGHYGLMTRSAGPQIRGGESAAMLRYAARPVTCMGDMFDVLVGLDWNNINRFLDEIPLGRDSVILTDPALGPVPEGLAACGARVLEIPFRQYADAVAGGRVNMAALGATAAVAGLPLAVIETAVRKVLRHKGADVVQAALTCVRAAFAGGETVLPAADSVDGAPERWNISGNEASGLGAIRAGVRLVAAYPITPASEMLEWLAPRLEQAGGALLQAEDELASVNMIIGASFGGVPALTATSGPGLSLMSEGLGLAIASETPVVVVNVMRGGPSTGIPTKSEQADLNIALYGFHGDAPHLVLAALDIRDCAFTTQWAVQLAEHLQTVAIVLSDQLLGQARGVVDPPEHCAGELQRVTAGTPGAAYRRYRITADGISPMAIPGTPAGMYTGDGLEHNALGTPSSLPHDHAEQLEKRLRKLTDFDYGEHWAVQRGTGAVCLLTWGSSAGAVFEAAARLTAAGRPTRVIALRLLAPLQVEALRAALAGAETLLVVEQNQSGQCFRYLKSLDALPAHARRYCHAGPLPLRPGAIITALDAEN
ncbi:MAG: 2-oxoacid:acceptor oxidoreductase subunit alpha [Pseudomonadota bacterium]